MRLQGFAVVIWKFSICLLWFLKARLLIGFWNNTNRPKRKIILLSAYLCNNTKVRKNKEQKNHNNKRTILVENRQKISETEKHAAQTYNAMKLDGDDDASTQICSFRKVVILSILQEMKLSNIFLNLPYETSKVEGTMQLAANNFLTIFQAEERNQCKWAHISRHATKLSWRSLCFCIPQLYHPTL